MVALELVGSGSGLLCFFSIPRIAICLERPAEGPARVSRRSVRRAAAALLVLAAVTPSFTVYVHSALYDGEILKLTQCHSILL